VPVNRQELSSLLWSRSGELHARASLRQALHALQEALGETAGALLQADRESVTLRAEGVWVDALRPSHEVLHRHGPSRDTGSERQLLAEFDGLDPAFDRWLSEQRRRWRDRSLLNGGRLRPGGSARSDTADRILEGRTEDDGEARSAADDGWPAATRRAARLGVLPLRIIGEGVAPHLPIGLAEAVTEALACFRWLFVADSASLAVAAQGGLAEDAPARQAARALGLDFLLGGSLQAIGNHRIRISFLLIDMRDAAGSTGRVVWSKRFEREAADLLALQDAVASEVVAQMDPQILLIETGRAALAAGGRRGGGARSAYDLLLQAIPAFHTLHREDFEQARALLLQAGRLDPDHAAIHAWHAYWNIFHIGQGWAEDENDAMAEAERLAARAVALDPMDAQALSILGHVRAFLHHQVEEAIALHRRALALNPNLAMAHVFLGMAESYAGAHESALRRLDRYRELAPCHPFGFFFDAARGIPLLFLHRHAEAAEIGRVATALQPKLSYPYKTYLSALGHLGLSREAAEVRSRLVAIEPDFTIEKALRRTPVRQEADRQHYAHGLRRAGLR
jgi:TolB-like protein